MTPTLVFLAAGLSTRYGRLKQLEPVGPGGEALLDYAVHDARMAGFRRILLIVRAELQASFEAHIRGRWPRDLEVVFHHQKLAEIPGRTAGSLSDVALAELLASRRKPWGTAHALLSARHRLAGSFAVVNADDFYGASAYLQAASLMREGVEGEVEDPPQFGLLAYRLQRTLSSHGGVSRGVCRVGLQGWLEEVEEVLDIRRGKGTIVGRTVPGEGVILAGDEPVSTNFWILTPAFFPLLETGFCRFLKMVADRPGSGFGSVGDKPPAQEAEFLIPTEVNRLIGSGEARVRVLEAHGEFFGITHPEDREWVAGRLTAMTREGLYADPLWG